MNELALFAGAGGGILGGKLLGWRTVVAVERDAYAAQVLAQRQSDGSLKAFPIWSDIESFDGRPWRGIIDVVSGGFPCQDISSAGKGQGLDGAKSGLWREIPRIVAEVRPRFLLLENSPVLTSRGLDKVLGDLATLGFDARWGVLGNGDVGPDQIGERMWIAATTECCGWAEILRSWTRICDDQGEEPCAPANVDPQDWTPRLRALEQMVGEPAILGSGDALAHQVDRLKAIGNGQVPALVAKAWRILGGSIA